MPKETFYNLPQDKARRIEAAAIDEFSRHPFKSASINRIVAGADIAKGSFYQYFHDKKDLYKHILMKIMAEKLTYLSPTLANPQSADFLTLLRELYLSGLRFAQSNPPLQKIGDHLLADRSNPAYQELISESMAQSDMIFQSLIRKGIEQGNLRPDLDDHLLAWLISRLNILLVDYYQAHVQLKLDEAYLGTVDKLIDFICHGISLNKRGEDNETGQ